MYIQVCCLHVVCLRYLSWNIFPWQCPWMIRGFQITWGSTKRTHLYWWFLSVLQLLCGVSCQDITEQSPLISQPKRILQLRNYFAILQDSDRQRSTAIHRSCRIALVRSTDHPPRYRRLAKKYHPDRNVDDPEAPLGAGDVSISADSQEIWGFAKTLMDSGRLSISCSRHTPPSCEGLSLRVFPSKSWQNHQGTCGYKNPTGGNALQRGSGSSCYVPDPRSLMETAPLLSLLSAWNWASRTRMVYFSIGMTCSFAVCQAWNLNHTYIGQSFVLMSLLYIGNMYSRQQNRS